MQRYAEKVPYNDIILKGSLRDMELQIGTIWFVKLTHVQSKWSREE